MSDNNERPFIELARIFMMHGDVNEQMHQRFAESLALLEHESSEPIYIHISSCGGDAYDMFGIIDLMRSASSPLITVCTGKAMSAAALILAAGQQGDRRIGRYSTIMLHEVAGGEWGKAYQLQNNADETKRLQDDYLELLARFANQKVSKFKKLFDTHKDTYINAKTALELGIVDKIF